MCKKSAQKSGILVGKRRETFLSKRNENDIKKLEKWMLYHLPGPRLTDTLRLSGSDLKCRQKTAGDFATSASAFSSLSRVGPQRKEEKRRQEERRRKKSNKNQEEQVRSLYPLTPDRPPPAAKYLNDESGDGDDQS